VPIDSHLNYLQKHAYCAPQIVAAPAPNLGLVVLVTANLEYALTSTLTSLLSCNTCDCAVEVIVAIVGSDTDSDANRERNLMCSRFANYYADRLGLPEIQFHVLFLPDLPAKHAGMGLARKLGMDEAINRFSLAGNGDGLIVSLDAGAVVEPDYLTCIKDYFDWHRQIQSCSIAFQYEIDPSPISSTLHDTKADAVGKEAVLRIELAERILIAGLCRAGHPYAFYTVGAAMAVRASAYQAQAGMSRRKAGEVFDFLQKFIEIGVHGQCLTTTVRVSGRSFQDFPGTLGSRVAQYCAEPNPEFPIFALAGFQELAQVLPLVKDWYALDQAGLELALQQFPPAFRGFMEAQGFVKSVLEVQKYTTNAAAFEKRFYRWFHSTRTFLYLGYCRDFHFPNAPILEVGNAMRAWILGDVEGHEELDLLGLLNWFRAAEWL
jgi:hypothetical protein